MDADLETSIDAGFAWIMRIATALFAMWIAAAWMCGEIATAYGRSRRIWMVFGLLCPGLSLACALNLKTPRQMAGISKLETRSRTADMEPSPVIALMLPNPAPAYP